VALFKPLKNNPKDADRICYVQTTSTWEKYEIGEEAFGYLKHQTKQSIAQQKLLKQNDSAERYGYDAWKGGQTTNASEVEVLGCFDDSAMSIGYTMTMNATVETGNDIARVKRVYSVMMMPVSGKLSYLYAEATLNKPADRLWTENALKTWRKSILEANLPAKVALKDRSFFDEIKMYPLMGGILGSAVSIFVILFQRAQKHHLPLTLLKEPSNTRSDPPSAAL